MLNRPSYMDWEDRYGETIFLIIKSKEGSKFKTNILKIAKSIEQAVRKVEGGNFIERKTKFLIK